MNKFMHTINKFLFIMKIFKTFSLQVLCYVLHFGNYNLTEHLLDELIKCNILFVKIYQGLAGNSVLLNDKYIQILKKYINKVPYTSKENDYKILSELGFNEETTQLINSGTIAVVYKSLYKNKEVIIKIKRDNLFLWREIENIEFICNLISCIPFLGYLKLNTIIKTNKEIILEQLDFKKEIANMQTMAKIHSRIKYVKIPFVYNEFTDINNDVIVMEYLHGRTIYEIDENEKEQYAEIFAQFGIKSLLFDGIYHADLHPGNVIFMKNNKQLVVGVIDFGLVNHLTRDEQNEYYHFFKFLNNKFNLASHILDNLSERLDNINSNSNSNINNREQILVELQQIVYVFYKKMTLNEIYLINKMLYKYNYKLKEYFYKLLLGLASCEGTMIYLTNSGENLTLINKIYQKMTNNLLINV